MGQTERLKIRSETDKEVTIIEAEGIKGEGDAEAARI